MIVGLFTMVSFFKTFSPIEYKSEMIDLGVKDDNIVKKYGDILRKDLKRGGGDGEGEGDANIEIIKVKYKNGRQFGSYLFTGSVEVYKSDTGEIKIVLRKFTGEWAGTVTYRYMRDNGKYVICENDNSLLKTVYILNDEDYLLFVDYEGDTKVALGIQFCPGDEIEFDKCLMS